MFVNQSKTKDMLCPTLSQFKGEAVPCVGMKCMAWRFTNRMERDPNTGHLYGYCSAYPEPKVFTVKPDY